MVTPAAVDKAKALICKSTANYVYFFNKLSSPEWIKPLRDAGFFQVPPEGDGFWPESRFLVRVSGEAPDAVCEVVMELPQTDNGLVLRDIVGVALKMPGEKAAAIASRFLPSFRRTHFSWMRDELCELVEKLAGEGYAEAALDLAGAILEVRAPLSPGDEDEGAATFMFRRGETHLRPHQYEVCTNRLAGVLAAALGVPAVAMLGGLLTDAIRFEESAEAEGPEDFSGIWLKALDSPVPAHSDPKVVLAYALTDSAKVVMQERPGARAEVLKYLAQGQYKVFWRIELHLLRLFPHGFGERINELIGSRACYDDFTVEREYRQLLAARFQELEPAVKKRYLAWAEQFFDFAKQEDELRPILGEDVPEDDLKALVKRRALSRLSGLRDSLPANWHRRYDELVEQVGEPDSPHVPPRISQARSVGPISPQTAEELEAMSNTELIDFLKKWQPPPRELGGDWLSPEGVGRQLEQVAKAAPSRFTSMIDDIKALEPTYVRHILEGLHSALGDEIHIDWEAAVRLCLWVTKEGIERADGERFDFWQDRHWGWAKGAAASLVASGFQSQSRPLPIGLRDSAWNVICASTKSADPSLDDDKRDIEEENSLLDRRINSRRGRAMQRVVQYALWLRRHFEHCDEFKPEIKRGFDAMPEVRDVLDWHLEAENDPSPVVRTVYGEFFPWLVLLDETWARSARPRVFPSDDSERELRYAAWGTYVISCPPYDKVVEILRDEYVAAIDDLGNRWPVRILRAADPESRLAEHLVHLYGRGALAAGDMLWLRFWQTAPDAVRAHALSFIGRTVDAEQDPLPDEVHDRFVALAATRIQAAEEGAGGIEFAEEMRALGWWFANEAFGDEWALATLNRALDITNGQTDAESFVAERLGKASRSWPQLAATCLHKMVAGTKELWGVLGQHDDIRTVLRSARDSGRAEAWIQAQKAIDILVSRGFTDYRDLGGS